MKLNILSDLHLGVSGLAHPRNDADAVILAGDIARPREAVAWALGFDKPVLYVPGNHEFYGSSLDGAVAELKQLCAGTPVHVLDNDEVILGGVRFLGSTLWTDFRLFGVGDEQAAAVAAAQQLMRDFSRIRVRDAEPALFTPADSAALFERNAAWLNRRLDAPHAGPTVVITHHAPSRQSIHPRFAGSPLNACFVSDADHLAGGHRTAWWIHGHTHDSFDYQLQGTRVICNSRGYAKAGVNENAHFDPDFMIEVVDPST
ncbi:metallophosphoesterase [Aquabacterium humicola]|uniref:metallophosphoesterase n=1 Tax=Aquabacterium humicola TaxID=3237377 RepID=UPI0025437297|nr:metallophosphoesterase [Rubrivivax pictus]